MCERECDLFWQAVDLGRVPEEYPDKVLWWLREIWQESRHPDNVSYNDSYNTTSIGVLQPPRTGRVQQGENFIRVASENRDGRPVQILKLIQNTYFGGSGDIVGQFVAR